ncbi:MAG: adenylate/guanylate cyclase domain-containing protein [Acidimicrobiia bacterium]
MEVPAVRYAFTSDDVRIAYQDYGEGPPTIICLAPFTHLEALWTLRGARRVLERSAWGQRVLVFDHRGTGMSDGFESPPSLEDRTLDVKAVMEAAELERANLFGTAFGGQLAIGVAARNPELVDRLVLMNSRVGHSGEARARELAPEVIPDSSAMRAARLEQASTEIGMDESENRWLRDSPSAANHPEDAASSVSYERMVGSRDVWRRQIESIDPIDIVDIAPLVKAPTLVTANNNRVHHIGKARLLHELIPNSTLVEFDGEDFEYWLADNWTDISDTHVEFLTGSIPEPPTTSRFATVMFTDLVDSTSASLAVGDAEWQRRLESHDQTAAKIIRGNSGAIIKQTGDGHLALFDRPDDALRAGLELSTTMQGLDMALRIGIHVGIVEQRSDDISGAVVNLASRVEGIASPNQILVTATVRDMLIGSTFEFEPAGIHNLKGFQEPWALHSVKPRT